MKKYNQPKTEIAIYCVANLMVVVSNGGTPPNEDPAHAPGRKGDIIS